MHILLTRPLEDSQELILRFKKLGHEISHMPLVKIEKNRIDKTSVFFFILLIFLLVSVQTTFFPVHRIFFFQD